MKKKIRDSLCAARSAMELLEVVSPVAVRSDYKSIWTLRAVLVPKRIPCKSRFEQGSTREVVQLLYSTQVRIEIAPDSRRCWSGEREPLAILILNVVQVSKAENVAGTRIDLHLGKVATAQEWIPVRTVGQILENIVVILGVRRVKEPDFAFLNWAGNCRARNPLVEANTLALLGLPGRNEVGGIEAKVIVPHSGVEVDNSTGQLPELGRDPRTLYINFAHCVGAEAHGKAAAHWSGDFKTVQY